MKYLSNLSVNGKFTIDATNGNTSTTGTLTWSGGGSTNANAAYTHITSTGADHSYINQSVTTSASPSFTGLTVTNTISGSISGNSATTTKLYTARTISLSTDATGSVSFDGSGNVTIPVTLANSGVTAGTYKSVTVDAKGRVTGGTNPTTLSGFGITDGALSNHNHNLDSLSNVLINTNSSGEILKWNGTAWVNNTLSEAGIQPAGTYDNYVSWSIKGGSSDTALAITTGSILTLAAGSNVSISRSGNVVTIASSYTDTNTVTTLTAGSSITISDGGTGGNHNYTINHADTSTLTGVQGTAGISSITVDDMGHVTSVGTATYLTSSTGVTSFYANAMGFTPTTATSGAVVLDGTLNVGHGGTGTTTAPTQGGIIYGSSASAYASTATGSSGQVLKSNGTSAPTWVTLDMSYLPDSVFKKSVKSATTADLGTVTATATTLTGSTVAFPNQDGIVITLNDRILVKNQTTTAQNGIYYLSTQGVASTTAWVLTRVSDGDISSEIAGAVVNVDQGTVNGGLLFSNNFKTTDTLGTTAMTWYQIYSTNDSTTANTANKLVLRDGSGNINAAKGAFTAFQLGTSTTAGYVLKADASGNGTWQTDTDTNTASAVDNILHGTNSGTAITYAPYTTQQATLSFDTTSTNPTLTNRLNLNGYLYATKLYSGGTEVSVNTHNHTLDSLSNVTITSNSSGEILKWNGTAWINNTLAEAGIQPAGTYDNYVSWSIKGGTSDTALAITGGSTLTISGTGSTTVSRSGNTITISSVGTLYSAGNGLTLSSTTFSVDAYTNAELPSDGTKGEIGVDATGIYVKLGTTSKTAAVGSHTHNFGDLSSTPSSFNPAVHGDTHRPGGADPIATAASVSLSNSSTNAEGTATTLARSDHSHAISGFSLSTHDHNKFLNMSDGTNIAVADDASDTFTFAQGGGLIVAVDAANDKVTYSHADTSSQASVDNSGNTFIQDVTLDTYGHITALTSTTVDFTVAANYAFQNLKIDNTDTEYTWVTTDATSIAADSSSDTATIVAAKTGSTYGIQVKADATNDAIGIAHADTSTLSGQQGTAGVSYVTVDEMGHVTAVGTATYLTTAVTSLSAGTTGLSVNSSTGAVTLSGTLITSNGGTGLSSYTAGDMIYYSSGTTLSKLGIGTAGKILRSTGSAPAWSTATYPDSTTINQILYSSAANAVTGLTTANTAALVTNSSGVPAFTSGTTANRVLRTDGTTISFAQVALGSDVSGTLPVGNGGTGTTTAPTQGGIIYSSTASAYGSTAAGTAGQVLKSNGTSAPTWVTLDMTYMPDAVWKKSVKAATTADLGTVTATVTTLTGTTVVFPVQDGITIALNDRLLVKNQTTQAQNGIYSLTTVGVAGTTAWVLTRVAGADSVTEVAGAVVNVDSGTINGGILFSNNFKTTDTLGTTAMPWYRVYSEYDSTSANTANKLVLRDGSGNFSAAKGSFTGFQLGTSTTAGYVLKADASGNGTWQADTDTNTATAANNILQGSNSGTQITYAPYSTVQASLSFDTTATNPTLTTRLNLNGYLYGTKLYSGGTEVSVITHTHSYLPLAGGTLTGALTLSGDPTIALHAATKQYVDNIVQGLDVKQSVLVATTANITLSGLQTIDGIALVTDNRVLVKDQTDKSQNGIYRVQSGAWIRAEDADISGKVTPGMYTWIEQGTVNQDSGWLLVVDGTVSLGTTLLNFVKFSGAGQITAGNGITKTGDTLSVDPQTGAELTANEGEIGVDATGVYVKLGTTATTAAAGNHNHDGVYLKSYTESDTLATVTGRGSTTSTLSTFSGGIITPTITNASGGNSVLKLGSTAWTQTNGEVNVLGEIVAGSVAGDSRLMIYSNAGKTNVYVDGTIYVNEGLNPIATLSFVNMTDGTNTAVADSNSDTFTFSQGGGLTVAVDVANDKVTYSHADTSSVANLTAASRTYVTALTFDTYGHVTGYSTGTETVVDTNTASAVDNILDGSNSGTAITYAPYTTHQDKLSFDTSTTNPDRTDRLNLNGNLYATNLYSMSNIGVGTIAPSEKVHVTGGNIKTDSDNGFITGSFKISHNTTTNCLDFRYVG